MPGLVGRRQEVQGLATGKQKTSPRRPGPYLRLSPVAVSSTSGNAGSISHCIWTNASHHFASAIVLDMILPEGSQEIHLQIRACIFHVFENLQGDFPLVVLLAGSDCRTVDNHICASMSVCFLGSYLVVNWKLNQVNIRSFREASAVAIFP